jgi:streptogramin lyase
VVRAREWRAGSPRKLRLGASHDSSGSGLAVTILAAVTLLHRTPRSLGAGMPRCRLAACVGALLACALVHVATASAEEITVGPEGDIWFTEAGVNAVGRITPEGAITQYPVRTPDSGPNQITAGPDGDLWFTQQQADEIGSITPDGAIRELPIPTPAVGIAVGADGGIWFTERSLGPGTIGRLIPGGGLQEFPVSRVYSAPASVAAGPEGNIWFTDVPSGSKSKIGRITPAGAVAQFPLPPFQYASDITAGPGGEIWFTVMGSSTTKAAVGRISFTGAITETHIPGNFDVLGGITAGPEGNVWFADTLEDEIRRITPAGTLSEWEVSDSPQGVAAAPDGDIWFTESPDTKIGRITPQGTISEFPIPRVLRCIVPDLRGETLVQAVRALHRAGCRLGKVRRVRARRREARVVSQAPYATAVYPRGAAVSVRLR